VRLWIFAALLFVSSPIVGCGAAQAPIQVIGEGVVHRGMATSVEGSASVSEGEACQILVEPTDNESLNCRVEVRCGSEILYGFPGAGFNRCAEDAGSFIAARDQYKTRADGDPAMGWDQRRHIVIVTDSAPDFTVTLALHAQ
jgi:hypothetical protein